jgi:hypothetical protein
MSYFYALRDDAHDVLAFVLAQDGWRVMEAYSRIGHRLRTFASLDEVRAASKVGRGHGSLHLMVHASETGGDVRVKRIRLGGPHMKQGTWRESVEGWGLIQLLFSTPLKGSLGRSRIAHNSRARATKWEPTYGDRMDAVGAWDWVALQRAGRRIENHVRRSAVAKEGTCAVLPAAHAAHQAGELVFLPS